MVIDWNSSPLSSGRDHVHKREVLSLKIAGEQSAGRRGKFEEPPIERFCEFPATDRIK